MLKVTTISLIEAAKIIDELSNASLTNNADATVNSGSHAIYGNCAIISTAGEESFLISI